MEENSRGRSLFGTSRRRRTKMASTARGGFPRLSPSPGLIHRYRHSDPYPSCPFLVRVTPMEYVTRRMIYPRTTHLERAMPDPTAFTFAYMRACVRACVHTTVSLAPPKDTRPPLGHGLAYQSPRYTTPSVSLPRSRFPATIYAINVSREYIAIVTFHRATSA